MTDQARRPASPFYAMAAMDKAGKAYTLSLFLRAGRTIADAVLISGDENWLFIKRHDGAETYEAVSNIRRLIINAL